ncbi:hypothetical protein SSX86_000747 [Deinandra increscens subsp. villosa]|uniref:Uncharacterized protein n=1 Tax=Deinandra increscens subsp. villosa TaxID=3103831 RepID=A0AAP0HBY9_9ASTR
MPPIFNLRSTSGLPLCLSGVTRHHLLPLSKEIADHDRRREEMKRAKTENRTLLPADEIYGEVREIVALRSSDLVVYNLDNDDDDDNQSSSIRRTSCTAKAA